MRPYNSIVLLLSVQRILAGVFVSYRTFFDGYNLEEVRSAFILDGTKVQPLSLSTTRIRKLDFP